MSDKPIHMTGKEYYDLLQKTRREALEEACKAVCWMCESNEPLYEVKEDGEMVLSHRPVIGLIPCHARSVRKLIAADKGQGQTTQAGPVEGKEGYTEQELKCAGCMGPCGQCNS